MRRKTTIVVCEQCHHCIAKEKNNYYKPCLEFQIGKKKLCEFDRSNNNLVIFILNGCSSKNNSSWISNSLRLLYFFLDSFALFLAKYISFESSRVFLNIFFFFLQNSNVWESHLLSNCVAHFLFHLWSNHLHCFCSPHHH